MPRPLRPQVAGGIYHLVSRGVRKLPILHRRRVAPALPRAARRDDRALRVGAACLVPDDESLPPARDDRRADRLGRHAVPERLLRAVVRLAARLRGSRLRAAILVGTDRNRLAPLAKPARYILLNPVRAGLCATATDWQWSSYRKTMGHDDQGAASLDHAALRLRPSPRNLPQALRRLHPRGGMTVRSQVATSRTKSGSIWWYIGVSR